MKSGKYPLNRFLYIYINKAPGKPLDPLVKEFLQADLSARKARRSSSRTATCRCRPRSRSRSWPSSSSRRRAGAGRPPPRRSLTRQPESRRMAMPHCRRRHDRHPRAGPAAGGRLRRVKRIDRLAVGFITLGGIFIIVAVLFIFVFIFGEALPLFRPASGEATGAVTLAAVPPLEYVPARSRAAAAARRHAGADVAARGPSRWRRAALVFGIDEYQRYIYEVLSDGRTAFFRASDGSFAKQLPPSSLGDVAVSSASRSLDRRLRGRSAPRTAASRCSRCASRPRYEDQKLVGPRPRGARSGRRRDRPGEAADPRGRLRGDRRPQDAARRGRGRRDRSCVRTRRRGRRAARGRSRRTTARRSRACGSGAATPLSRRPRRATSTTGSWLPEPRLTEVVHVSEEPITALEYVLGNITLDRGRRQGQPARAGSACGEKEDDPDPRFVKAHAFPPPGRRDPRDRRLHARQELRDGRHRRLARAAPHDLGALGDLASRPPGRRSTPCCSRPRWTGSSSSGRTASSRATRSAQPASGGLAGARCSARSGTRATPQPEYVWQSHRRHRRLRDQVQPGAARLRHDQGHVLRAAVRDPARDHGRALHLAVHAPDASRRASSRRSRSWPRCRASWSASSRASGSPRASSARSCRCC